MHFEELPGLHGVESETQAMLRTSLAELLEREAPAAVAAAALESAEPFPDAAWSSLVGAGWTSSLYPEEVGGQALTIAEMAPAISIIGAHLLPGPFLSSAIVVPALVGGIPEFSSVFSELASGRKRAAAALWEKPVRGFGLPVSTTTVDGKVTGAKHLVPDAAVADVLLVRTQFPGGQTGFVLVEADAPGVSLVNLKSLAGRNLSHVTLDSAPALAIGPADGPESVDTALRMYSLLIAFLQFGGAHAGVSLATVYARERVQFGRPIGSFQAVSHRLADMYCNVAVAGAVALQAANAVGNPVFARTATMAKLLGNRSYSDVAAGALQVFGGIGYTFEHPIHLYLRMAKVLAGTGATSEECVRSLQNDFPTAKV